MKPIDQKPKASFFLVQIQKNQILNPVALLIQIVGDDLDSTFDPLTAQLAESSMADLAGKIVFQPYLGFRDWLQQVKYLQEQGAIAILYGTTSRKRAKSGSGSDVCCTPIPSPIFGLLTES